MKIGILSMQKILNYGSFLQAFSLKKQFENRGHEVYFIDIEDGKHIASDDGAEKFDLSKKFDKYFLKRIENYLLSKKMTKIHIKDYKSYLETDKKLDNGECFDLAVIGSDEVFNCTVPSKWGFSTQLFGNIKNAKHIVTYAASCGSTDYDTADGYGIINELRDSMGNLEHISVRDKNTFDFVERITGCTPCVNIDPVFLTDFDEYIGKVNTKMPYLLVYAYSNRITDTEEINAIKQYAKSKNLEIVCVGMQQRWCKNNIPANAFELLGYVKNADCIVTDTFHGTVFSIKYNKKFISFVRKSNFNKLYGLLQTFGLTSRVVDTPKKLKDVMETRIDFDAVNECIHSEQKKSYEYLDIICLSGAKDE